MKSSNHNPRSQIYFPLCSFFIQRSERSAVEKRSFPYFDPNWAGIIQTNLDTLCTKSKHLCEGSSIGTKVTTEINLQTKANHRPLIEQRRCPSLNNLQETQSTSSKAAGASGWLSPTLWAQCRAGNQPSQVWSFTMTSAGDLIQSAY